MVYVINFTKYQKTLYKVISVSSRFSYCYHSVKVKAIPLGGFHCIAKNILNLKFILPSFFVRNSLYCILKRNASRMKATMMVMTIMVKT